MTNTEAISILNGYNLRSEAGVKGLSALDIGIEAIKKQMPQNPIVDPANLCDFQNFYCPKCNKYIVSKLDGEWLAGKLQNYCDCCGQALDWGEDECTTT